MPSTTSTAAPRPMALVIAAQVGAALLCGAVAAPILGYGVGLLLSRSELGMGLLSVMIFAALVGFGLGAGAGVGLAGRLLGRPGRLWPAVAAGGGAGALVILAMRLLQVGGFNGIILVCLPAMLLAALLAYHLPRPPA